MKNSTTKLSLFVALALAIIKGDDAEATAIKIQKKAISVLTAQIAAKECHTLTLEENLESNEHELATARVNGGNLIKDNTSYITILLTRRNSVSLSKEVLNNHLEEIEFLRDELEAARG